MSMHFLNTYSAHLAVTLYAKVMYQGPVVQSLDNSIQWINRYLVDKMTPFVVLIG